VYLVLAGLLLIGVSLACGRPSGGGGPTPSGSQPAPSGRQSVPIVGSQPPAGARQAVSVQLKPGVDPNAVAARVLGPNAFIRSATRGAANPPIGAAARRTYLIPVAPAQEGVALGRARGDADVEQADLVPWPPDFP
jgi:hypothetical protein